MSFSNNVLGIIFANAYDRVLSDITAPRAMGSVPFGGAFRLIDFVLSNMVNCGMSKIGVITNNNYQSLMDHLGSGRPWDLARKNDGLFILPPFNSEAVDNNKSGRIGALKNIERFLERSNEEYVVLSDCNVVCSIDFEEIGAFHLEKNADITVITKKGTAPELDNLVKITGKDDNGRVTAVKVGGGEGVFCEYAVNMLLMRKALLETLVTETFAGGEKSFERDVIASNINRLAVYCYDISDTFCPVIDSMQSYFEANFALLNPENRKKLFRADRPVYTKAYDDMPVVYGLGSDVRNSLIADGCIINGEVENSILFRDCRVEKDAVVKNCILMPGDIVSDGAMINYVIMDKYSAIKPRKSLSGADTYLLYIGKGIVI